MALRSIPIPPDAARDKKARELVPQVKTWHTGTLKRPWGAFEAGTAYFITRNGYRVNAVFCTCDDYKRGHICKHIRAVVLSDAQKVTKPAPTYEALYPTCQEHGCDNDPEPKELYCWRHVLVDAF